MSERHRGRGRLSSIDMLPEEASDIVVWATQELAKRARTQLDIYAEFRDRLIALQGEQGLAFNIPAFQSFNRFSLRKAALARQMEETYQLTSALAETFRGQRLEDTTIVAIEALKSTVLEATARGEVVTSKQVLEMARAMQALEAAARTSETQRRDRQSREAARDKAAIDKAAAVAREAGVSAEAITQMRRDFLGVRQRREKRSADDATP